MTAATNGHQAPSILTWLYVPGDRADRLPKALGSDADAVIVDLEDAVAPADKALARAVTAEFLSRSLAKPVVVRVNALDSPWIADDIAAIRDCPGLSAIRVPKVSGANDVDTMVGLIGARPVGVQCLVESALGLENAFEIAQHGRVVAIGLGEADLRADIGATSETGLAWARSRIINAASAAGLPSPPQSVYPYLQDQPGLEQSCAIGRELGFFGRAAIHPNQLATIVNSYVPTLAEVEKAKEIVQAASVDTLANGSIALPDGRFVDAAIVAGANRTIAVVERHGTRTSPRPTNAEEEQ